MKRRCEGIDYKGRKMYMVTLVTENRRALFGEIVGRSNAPKNSADAPHINLTPLGERVRDNFLSIQNRYEEVKVIALQMMPDHLHGILFVTTQMQQHLGQVISGFKSGCNKDYRELILGGAFLGWVRCGNATSHTTSHKANHAECLSAETSTT